MDESLRAAAAVAIGVVFLGPYGLLIALAAITVKRLWTGFADGWRAA